MRQMERRLQFQRSSVPIGQTKGEIDEMLRKHGSQTIQWTEDSKMGIVQLMFNLKYVVEGKEMLLPIRIRASVAGKNERAVYRALLHHLLAKWTAIDYNLTTLEEEFLPWVVLQLPGGRGDSTVGEVMLPGIRKGSVPFIGGLKSALLTEGGGK